MPKNRNLTYGDQQAQVAREKKLNKPAALPTPAPAPEVKTKPPAAKPPVAKAPVAKAPAAKKKSKKS